jgi:hypothetical protein
MNEKKIWNYNKIKSKVYMNVLLWKYFYLLASVFVVSTKRIDPWVLEFMVSNTTGNNQWENCISLDFYSLGQFN